MDRPSLAPEVCHNTFDFDLFLNITGLVPSFNVKTGLIELTNQWGDVFLWLHDNDVFCFLKFSGVFV